MSDVIPEDLVKGVQGIPIVESSAHFDLTEGDVAVSRAQGIEITSLRARSAYADERVFDRENYLSDERASTIMHELKGKLDRLPPSEEQHYQLESEADYSLTLHRADGSLIYREAGGVLLHNQLKPEDESLFCERLARASVVSAQDAQRLVGLVIDNLDKIPPDPNSTLTLEWEADSILLKRADGSPVFHQLASSVLVNGFRQSEWDSLSFRLSQIKNQSPDADPDLDR